MLFGKNKQQSAVPSPAPTPAPAKKTLGNIVDPNDFFSDIDKKKTSKRAAAAAVSAEVEVPEVTGLREAPPPAPVCTVDSLSTDTLSTDGLIDKAALYDGAYHGNMGDIDDTSISFESLRAPMELPPQTEEE